MTASGATLFEALWRLKDLPDWLRPQRLKSAMQRTIAEFAHNAAEPSADLNRFFRNGAWRK